MLTVVSCAPCLLTDEVCNCTKRNDINLSCNHHAYYHNHTRPSPDLTVTFIGGHTPTLYIRKDGTTDVAESFNLSDLTTDQIVSSDRTATLTFSGDELVDLFVLVVFSHIFKYVCACVLL